MALESLPKIAPALFSAEQDLIEIYNKKTDTRGTINPSYIKATPSGSAGAIQFSDGSAFASDGANLFWDDTNKRLGIGTNAPITALHINGQTTFSDNALFSADFKYIGRDLNNSSIRFASASSEIRANISTGGQFHIYNSGSGTSRFAVSSGGQTTISGSGSTSATTSLLVQNSAGNEALKVTDDGLVTGASITSTGTLRAANNKLEVYNSGNQVIMRNPSVGNYFYIGPTNTCGCDTAFQCGGSLFVVGGGFYGASTSSASNTVSYDFGSGLNPFGGANSATLNISGTGRLQGGASGQIIRIAPSQTLDSASNILTGFYFNPTLNGTYSTQNVRAIQSTYGGAYLNTATPQASAILQADSTTQGFLPPRMTDAQIRAIASPANGLIAYNTTTDHLCVYQGGAWVKINHSPM